MKIIFVENENDYDALEFENEFEVTLDLWNEINNGKEIERFNARAIEFGEVDPRFVSFIQNKIADEDAGKHTNFFVVPE